MKLRRRMIVAVLVPMLALGACGKSKTTETQGAPSSVEVRAGINDSQDPTIAVLAFLPASVTVKTGATVNWTAPGPEPHTITFMANNGPAPAPDDPAARPLESPKPPSGAYDGTTTISSGVGPRGPQPMTFSVSFSKAGSYTYHCIIHTGMGGAVVVSDDASKADAASAVTTRGDGESAQWLAEGRSAKQQLSAEAPKKTTNSDGTTTWTVEMGTSTQHTAILAFQPVAAAVKKGDKVVFVNNSAQPHTSTFGPQARLPKSPNAPEAVKASGKSPVTLKAGAFLNTGWLPPNVPEGPPLGARSFTFVVPDAGTYAYVCLLHAPSGMAASIIAS